MDYKSKLNQMVTEQQSKLVSEEDTQAKFENRQHEMVSSIRKSLLSIFEGISSEVATLQIRETWVEVKIKGPGSMATRIDIEGNSYLAPSRPAPGFRVNVETTYNNGMVYIEPTKSEKVISDKEEVLNLVMKYLAEAIASKKP